MFPMHSEHFVLVEGSQLCVNGLTEMTDATQVEAFGSLKCSYWGFSVFGAGNVKAITIALVRVSQSP